jgi:HSP20 family molecular chaperone IbpA
MQRVFRLRNIKADEISAKLDNGILVISAPKLDVMDNTIKIDIQ